MDGSVSVDSVQQAADSDDNVIENMRDPGSDPLNRGRPAPIPADYVRLGLIALAPWLAGSVHPVVVLLEAVITCVLLAEATLRARRTDGALCLPLGGLAVALAGFWGLLQLVPLPSSLAGTLSAGSDLLWKDVWRLWGLPHSWHPLTTDPPLTVVETLRVFGLAAMVVMEYEAVTRCGRAELRRLSLALSCSGALALLVGIAGQALGFDFLLGLYEPLEMGRHNPGLRATFVNPNHQAAFFGIAALASAAALATAHSSTRAFCGALLAANTIGLFLSRSIGGIGVFASGLVLVTVLWLIPVGGSSRSHHSKSAAWVAMAVVTVVAGASLAIQAGSLLDDITTRAARDLGLRLQVARDALAGALRFPLVGVGLGATPAVFPMFNKAVASFQFVHVENEPVQAVLEIGFPVGLSVLVLLLLTTLRTARHKERGARALWFAMVCLGVHNLVDFNLRTNGIALPAAAILGLVSGIARRGSGLRLGSRTTVVLCALTGVSAVATLLSPYGTSFDRDIGVLRHTPAQSVELVASALMSRHPAAHFPPLVMADYLMQKDRLRRARDFLEAAKKRAPALYVVRHQVVRLYLRMGKYALARQELDKIRRSLGRWPLEAFEAIYRDPKARDLMVHLAPPKDPDRKRTLELADYFAKKGRVALLERLLLGALRTAPGDPVYAFRLGVVYLRRGVLDRAGELATEIMALHPDATEGSYLLGMVLLSRNRPFEALHMLLEALNQAPEDMDILAQAVHAALRTGDLATAKRLAESGTGRCKGRKGCKTAYYVQAQVAEREGRLNEAVMAAERAARFAPNDTTILKQLADLYVKVGQPGMARMLLLKLIHDHPKDDDAWNRLRLLRSGQ